MDDKTLLDEQLAYYSARAQEYDESIHGTGRFAGAHAPNLAVAAEWAAAVEALRSSGPFETALELACGTGQWTKDLATMCGALTALDGAAEMLAVNRAAVGQPNVSYMQADLFAWEPVETYDLVFFAFWISHVPPEQMDAFLAKVRRAARPGGRVFVVDEHATGRRLSGQTSEDGIQVRPLLDGRTFRVVKRYYEPEALAEKLRGLGFEDCAVTTGEYFFRLTGRRT